MLAQSERHAEAAQLLGPIIDDAAADAGDRCESAEICATALFADDLDGMGRIVSSWYETLPSHSTMRHLVGVNQLAFLMLHRGHEGVQIYLLRALATRRCGQDARELMEGAVSAAEMWGLARILADTHPDLCARDRPEERGALLRRAERDPGTAAQPAGPARVKASASPQVRIARGSLMSPREREVLQLLAANLSNKQIALAMGVADETIKWHRKNLFGKLSAASRSHLLHRARMLGILDAVG